MACAALVAPHLAPGALAAHAPLLACHARSRPRVGARCVALRCVSPCAHNLRFVLCAPSYIVRRHVLFMLSAVRRLQRVARSFLDRNRVFWDKVRAAILMQAAWRGFSYRVHHEEVLAFLALMRERRAEDKAAASFQAAFRMVLHRRRYLQLLHAAVGVQHWARGRIARTEYLREQRAARKIQAGTRGMLARTHVRSMRTANQVADEAWRLKTVREREALQLARVSTSLANLRIKAAVAKRQPVSGCAPLDVDMVVDASDVYALCWSAWSLSPLNSCLSVQVRWRLVQRVWCVGCRLRCARAVDCRHCRWRRAHRGPVE